MSSPRPWRCFCRAYSTGCRRAVFSTPVEVFPMRHWLPQAWKSLLHARGGVSASVINPRTWGTSSPRPWRCFQGLVRDCGLEPVFSTPVEVFPRWVNEPVEVFLLPVSHHRLEVGAVFQSSTRRISRRPGLDESLKASRPSMSLGSCLPGSVVNQVDGVFALERQDEVIHSA